MQIFQATVPFNQFDNHALKTIFSAPKVYFFFRSRSSPEGRKGQILLRVGVSKGQSIERKNPNFQSRSKVSAELIQSVHFKTSKSTGVFLAHPSKK